MHKRYARASTGIPNGMLVPYYRVTEGNSEKSIYRTVD